MTGQSWVPGDLLPGVTLDGYADHFVEIKSDHGVWCQCERGGDEWTATYEAFRWVPDMPDQL